MTHSWGSKFVAIVFSFIIHTENYSFVGTGIRGLYPSTKTTKIGIPQNLSHPQYSERILLTFPRPAIIPVFSVLKVKCKIVTIATVNYQRGNELNRLFISRV